MNENGGPAFPFTMMWDERRGEYVRAGDSGMTLRDYFAANAISAAWKTAIERSSHENWPYTGAAVIAYDLADAMLMVRAFRHKPKGT